MNHSCLDSWGPIFRRFYGLPWLPNGSLNESLDPVCNKDISVCILSKDINIVRHELLTFRLPFVGHGIPWKRHKMGPPFGGHGYVQK